MFEMRYDRARGSRIEVVAMTKDQLISRNKEIMSGALVFAGTRVPVKTLLDYLKAGDSLDEFLDDFPTVKREQAEGVLELLEQHLPALP